MVRGLKMRLSPFQGVISLSYRSHIILLTYTLLYLVILLDSEDSRRLTSPWMLTILSWCTAILMGLFMISSLLFYSWRLSWPELLWVNVRFLHSHEIYLLLRRCNVLGFCNSEIRILMYIISCLFEVTFPGFNFIIWMLGMKVRSFHINSNDHFLV